MTSWADEAGLRWRAMKPFGVEIDTDLADLQEPAASDCFIALYREYGLVVARGQAMTMAQQTALLAPLGPILESAGETGYISTENDGASLSELRFHADGVYAVRPLDALSLYAVDVVDGASSMRFVSAERGWAMASPAIQDELAGRSVRMISPALEILGQRPCDVVDPPFIQSGIKPICYRHGKTDLPCLWVSEMHAASIEGMGWEEGRALLHRLFDILYAPANMLEHRWHRGDLVIWDNVRYQHARGPLAAVGRRILQRVIVGTEGEGGAPYIQPT
jgi:taurine dioxygenase